MRFLSLFLFILLHEVTFGQITAINHQITSGDMLNETSMAINHQNEKELVMASNINDFWYSKDGGLNLKHFKATSELGIYGDPVLHYSGNQLFYAHLSKTYGKTYGDWFDRIVVQKITDLDSWQNKSYSVGYNQNKMQDKPWLSSDNWSSKYKDQVYVTWTEFDVYNSNLPEHKSRIRFSYYSPQNDSFSTAITISDTTGGCLDNDYTLEGAVTAVGAQGEIYAVWSGHNLLYFDKSTDGGLNWGKDKIIAEHVNGWDMEIPHIMRANGMPFIACDRVSNTIYICWADDRNGDGDIWLIYSKDQGENWSTPLMVNEHQNGHQFFPNMTLNELSHEVIIGYYDQSRSQTGMFYDVMLSCVSIKDSLDIKYYTMTDMLYSLPGERFFFGDYMDVDFSKNYCWATYTTYSGTKTSVHLRSISPKIKTEANNLNRVPTLNVIADKNIIHLNAYFQTSAKVKGKLYVYQQGSKQKQKFKISNSEGGGNEYILASMVVDPNQAVSLSFKYKITLLASHKKEKHTYQSMYH